MSRRKLLFLCCLLAAFSLKGQDTFDYQTFKDTLFSKQAALGLDPALEFAEKQRARFTAQESASLISKEIAFIQMRMGDFEKADSIYKAILPWFLDSEYLIETLQIYSSLGRLNHMIGDLARGLLTMEDARAYMDSHSDELTSDLALRIMAEIHRATGILHAVRNESTSDGPTDLSFAESYFRKAYELSKQASDVEMEGLSLFNIGNVKPGEDSTIYYWTKALEVFEENGIDHRKYNVYQNLGILNIDKQDYAKGLEYIKLSEEFLPPVPDPFDLALIKVKLGKAYAGLEQFDLAISNLNDAISFSTEYDLHSIEGEAYEIIMQVYAEVGRYKDAYETYIKYDTLTNRFEQTEIERVFSETEAKYKTKEQQDQIQILEQREELNNAQIRQQRLVLVIVAVVLILIGLLSYLLWKKGKERQALNQQLKKLDLARKRFLMNVSHELRTPLTLIHAPLQDSLEKIEIADHSKVKTNLKRVSRNVGKLLQLTEEVLDISRLDEGALKLEVRTDHLQKFLKRTFSAFESLAVKNKIAWNSKIEVSEDYYEQDFNKLEKILNNLLSNAIKNTPPGGEINFIAESTEGTLTAKVVDSGRGIPEAQLNKIFERYYQVNETNSENPSGGLGVGLSLVKELLNVLKGDIQVESTVGEGTTFIVTIPLGSKMEAPETQTVEVVTVEEPVEPKRPAIDFSSDERPHILVVEDNPEMAEFMQDLLSETFRVTRAENGKVALDRIKSNQFDLITADIMMPEMDGIEFVENLKNHSDWQHFPVVMITALSEEADRVKGLKLGIDDYINKPFSPKELLARINNLLINAQSRKEAIQEEAPDDVGSDQQLLITARAKVEEHIANGEFTVKELADALNLSERQANRVLKKLTGLSSLLFVREIRLLHAYRLLEKRNYRTIAEVAYAVGFENSSYFTRKFTDRFGKKPSELLN